jgi:hypothetical protein
LSHDSNFNRAEFAWGLADSLIEIGVRCVIAAGWAVDDHPAEVFATTFYREILARKPFISAVAAAREAAWNEDRSSNTWAAYQAYGDPNWVYRRGSGGPGDTASAPIPPREEFEGIASPLGLSLALEELAVKSKWMRAEGPVQLEKIRHLEARFAALWGGMGAVAEAVRAGLCRSRRPRRRHRMVRTRAAGQRRQRAGQGFRAVGQPAGTARLAAGRGRGRQAGGAGAGPPRHPARVAGPAGAGRPAADAGTCQPDRVQLQAAGVAGRPARQHRSAQQGARFGSSGLRAGRRSWPWPATTPTPSTRP